MTLGERIKKVRRSLDLTQQAFAERLGMKRNSIAQIEMGRNTADQTIVSICREFNVSESWLRTGAGPMFIPTQEDSIDELIKQHDLDDLGRQIIIEFIKLESRDRQAIIAFVRNLSKHISLDEEPIQSEADKKAAFMKLAEESYDSEQERATRTLSAKESDAV